MSLNLTASQKKELKRRIDAGEVSKDEQKQLYVTRYRDEPLKFARFLLADHMTDRLSGKIIEPPEFHGEVMDLYMRENRMGIAAPRGHAKTTLTSFFYVMYCLLYQVKRNVVIISATEDLATRFLRRLKGEFETNARLIWLFGEQKTGKWSERELHLANGCIVYAKGRGGQIRGLIEGSSRPDLIVLDDLEDEELVRSEMRRMDLEAWFNGDVLPTLEPKVGQLIYIGTILHQDSLLNRVLDKTLYPEFETRRYAAIKEDGELLWPGRFDKGELQSIKESYIARGKLANFYMEYMNDPMPSEAATFKQSYFQFFEDLPWDATTELFVDLGGGSVKKTADDSAFVVLATGPQGELYVQDYVSKRMGTDTDLMVDTIIALTHEHSCRKVYIEKTVASNMLVASLDRSMKKKGAHINIEYVSPGRGSADRRGNMSDGKYQRIAAMEAAFKLGRIKMRKWMTKLVDQLLTFPRGKHDDVIDALSYGYMYGKKTGRSKRKRFIPNTMGYLGRARLNRTGKSKVRQYGHTN